jgi:hypothetical protein
MRHLKNIMFFVFVSVAFAALWVNIIVISSTRTSKIDVLTKVNGIYFDESILDKEKIEEIDAVINSNNPTLFSQLILQKDPIKEFYGFCGLMKSNQKAAIKHLDRLLLSSKKVTIYINGQKTESILGYAILVLIKNFPEYLSNPPIDDFYSMSKDSITKAYKSNLVNLNTEYAGMITAFIDEKYPEIKMANASLYNKSSNTQPVDTKIVNISSESIKTKTKEEKVLIAQSISSISSEKKEEILITLLSEKDPAVLTNAINSITGNESKNVANSLETIFKGKYPADLTILAVKKYSQILKGNSVDSIQGFMKQVNDNEKILMACLEQIYNYGNASSYEFLKFYLEPYFSNELNIYALKTIAQTTYKTNPGNVLRTMNYVIGYVEKEPVVVYAIKFYLSNSISDSSKTVFTRLSKKDTPAIKKLAIEYIEKYKYKDGKTILEELSNDADPEIQAKAKEALGSL